MTVPWFAHPHRTTINAPTASYRDFAEGPAFLTSAHPCVLHDVQQDVHPQAWKFQDLHSDSLLWHWDLVSSSPSASPKLFRGSYCASSGSFCCASPGQEYPPHPGESDPHAPVSHGLTYQLTLEVKPKKTKKKKKGKASLFESRLLKFHIMLNSNFSKYGLQSLGAASNKPSTLFWCGQRQESPAVVAGVSLNTSSRGHSEGTKNN